MLLDHRRFLAGDPGTTQAFLQTARWWVRRFFHKRSQIDAVVHDAMVDMLTKLESGDEPDPERVEQWILLCANNATRRELTRVRHNVAVPYESALHGNDHAKPSEEHRHRVDVQQIDATLHACKEHLQRMFLLRLQGYTHDEIAKLVGSKAGATRMAMSRLRRRLADELIADSKLNFEIQLEHPSHHDDSSIPRT